MRPFFFFKAERKDKSWLWALKAGLEYGSNVALYRGTIDLLNFEVTSELKEAILPGVTWTLHGKANYKEQHYRFGAGIEMHM